MVLTMLDASLYPIPHRRQLAARSLALVWIASSGMAVLGIVSLWSFQGSWSKERFPDGAASRPHLPVGPFPQPQDKYNTAIQPCQHFLTRPAIFCTLHKKAGGCIVGFAQFDAHTPPAPPNIPPTSSK